MHGDRVFAVGGGVPAFEVVPGDGERADRVVAQPIEAMQIESTFAVHHIGGEALHLLVRAVYQHEARPILSRILGLRLAVHLHRFFGHVVVLHAAECLGRIPIVEQARDVLAKQKIAVDEYRPARVPRKIRGQEARERELGRCQGIGPTPVQAARPEVILLYGGDPQRDRAALLEREFAHPVGDILSRVPAYENSKRGHRLATPLLKSECRQLLGEYRGGIIITVSERATTLRPRRF